MSVSPSVTGAQLANALQMLGGKFIFGGNNTGETLHKHPPRLIAALAENPGCGGAGTGRFG